MRISATGRTRRFPFGPRVSERGFTLVELLIVLSIIGLASAGVLLAMPGSSGSLRSEGETFAARAHAAQESAILDARPVALRIGSTGYAFESLRAGKWSPISEAPLEGAQWAAGIRASLGPEGAVRTVLDSAGMADPVSFSLVREGEILNLAIGADGKVKVGG